MKRIPLQLLPLSSQVGTSGEQVVTTAASMVLGKISNFYCQQALTWWNQERVFI